MTDPLKGRNAPVRKVISQERLKELLHYDPLTGHFTRRVDAGDRYKAGTRAGNYDKRYRRIRLDDVSYYEHRLAFIYMTGACPEEIDHIDCDKQNNAFANLRGCDHRLNNGNRTLLSTNTSGLKGASFDRDRGLWMSQIHFKGQNHHLGRFLTREQAHEAYVAKAREFYGNFFRIE